MVHRFIKFPVNLLRCINKPVFITGECISERAGVSGNCAHGMSTINSNEHSAKRYVRSEPDQLTALEYHGKPGTYR